MSLFLIIYSGLIVQLIYFLISSICYLYHNPKYRVFWAAFCINNPTNIKPELLHNGECEPQIDTIIKSVDPIPSHTFTHSREHSIQVSSHNSHHSHPTHTHTDLSSSRPSILSTKSSQKALALSRDSELCIRAKLKRAFIHFGLETLSHCILVQLYLICLLFLLCIRLVICYVTVSSKWNEYRVFCSYAFNLFRAIGGVAHYTLLIIICIPPLRIQYLYKDSLHTNQFQRILPVVSIIFMVICIPIAIIKNVLIQNEVKPQQGATVCAQGNGFGMNRYFVAYLSFQYYCSFMLCFCTVMVPIYQQRKMLMNLPKTHENDKLVTLILKINGLSKRVSVSAVIIILVSVIINVLYWFLAGSPKIHPFISIAYWSFYVECYFVIIFIYKDWKIRLCALCEYKYINISICSSSHSQTHTGSNDMEIDLVSSGKASNSTSIGVPNLVRDVSKQDVSDDTFPI